MAMETFGVAGLQALNEMLKPPGGDESDSDDDMKPKNSTQHMGPGDVGPKPATVTANSNASKPESEAKKNSKDIWDSEEINTGAEYEDIHDPRPQPEYDIVYKQAVSSEDMFLGMGNKTNASASCEDIVVKVKLPGQKIADVKLDVKKQFLDCRTPKYKLGLHLPHPVDAKSGKAQWDGTSETLSVTLRLAREYDFMNF